jgi:HPt (histidine-containing phosphotransfer) domain-containing protein
VALIEDAVEALRADALDDATAAEATSEAHKLAGALGTFGMPEGTTQARAIERALTVGVGPGDAPALAERAAALRTVVEGGGAAPG